MKVIDELMKVNYVPVRVCVRVCWERVTFLLLYLGWHQMSKQK